MPKFYLTTPIYYVNARPHIGHAYTTLAADTIARRHRLLGDDTFFLTGTDEHGQKIERSAAAAGIPPQQFADEVSASFENLWQRMGITHDAFIRTTSDAHKRGAQKLFADLHARGQIYLSSYTGQYSIGEEMFVEGPPGTIGPDGKPTETVTEENFFFRLSEYQCPLLDLIESDTLLIQPEARKNEVLSFLRGDVNEALNKIQTEPEVLSVDEESTGLPTWHKKHLDYSALGKPYAPGALRDLSVSRSSFTWGIPVPEPAASETRQKHVIYVWLDALANYMTALGYGSDDLALFEKFWPADLHLVGKEIIRFHCVYWPAFLLALNPKLQHAPGEPTPELSFEEHKEWAKQWLPKAVTAHGWLLFDDSKMSKSKGNIVRTETIIDAFGTLCPPVPIPLQSSGTDLLSSRSEAEGSASPASRPPTKPEQDLFATDVLRYFLLREIPFGQDGSFSFDALITRYNADLANGYGNLVSRTLTLINQNFQSTVPAHSTWGTKGIVIFELRSGRKQYSPPLIVADVELARLAAVMIHFEREATLSLRFSLAIDKQKLLADLNASVELEKDERGALDYINLLIAQTDQFLSLNAPWKLAKSDAEKDRNELADILYQAAESIRIITALLYPFLPFSTASVWQQLGLGNIELSTKNGELTNLQWGGLKPGTKLGPLSPIFPRADKGLAQIMIDMEAAKAPPAPSPLVDEKTTATPEPQDTNHPGAGPRTATLPDLTPGTTVGGSNALTTERTHTPHTEAAPSGIFAGDTATPQIAIDDFVKVDLRVAQIVVAERIPKADKLLRLEVDLGSDFPRRQILSGIAEWYTPEELIGRRIVIIANLASRKMRGLESHGMLLAASSGENTKPILTTFGEEIALGSRVR